MNEGVAGDDVVRNGFATVVITCCNRPDELEQTLTSMLACDLSGVSKFVVIDDSGCEKSAGVVARLLSDFDHVYLQNPQNIGQIRSVDRAYAQVETPYIFHCEEDWVFPTSLFLNESRALLDAFPEIHAVMLRDTSERPEIFSEGAEQVDCGVRYFRADPKSHRRWGSFSFNPGLRRLSDYKALGPFSAMGPERDISFDHKMRGFVLVNLSDGDVRHIGHNPTEKKDEKARKKAKGYLWKSLNDRIRFLVFKLTR
ncbi:glycosyltransferase family A protein [Sulfitobacter sp. F26169L]|uniref:glycosyltransferase family A protein n=1 Tax=Sulfitobacter sp. F26169L TaxID=2996015 RepID=UPI002260C0F1|nr:glycosyltransferase family A protein [Sulfitobacter sp. F26169L]MCX7567224.1 glycosyltransferase family A protein [Sulfitobacter sp. F26169L]